MEYNVHNVKVINLYSENETNMQANCTGKNVS